MSRLDREIAFVERAIQRADDTFDARFPFYLGRYVCCVSCKYGSQISDWGAAQDRRRAWLAVLLRKRALRDSRQPRPQEPCRVT